MPLLALAADGSEHVLVTARDELARQHGSSDAEREIRLPKSGQRVFDNRVSWAKVHLQRAGLLSSKKPAHFEITTEGRAVLLDPPKRIDRNFLMRYPEYVAFRKPPESDGPGPGDHPEPPPTEEPPEETFERAHEQMRAALAADLLLKIRAGSPAFFEKLVVDLLLGMGYGGSRSEAGEAIGRAGDGGIDGIIREDRLGLDTIYLQAKRWERTVGRPEIQQFVGALHGRRARKGVFLTTSSFSKDAIEYVEHVDPKVVLIDGEELAALMIDHGVGVTTVETYDVCRVDNDYFGEE